MTRKIDQTGLNSIKQWEGLRTKAYQDTGGVWTIGYGHTAAAGLPKPYKDLKITEEKAEEILINDLALYEKAVETSVTVKLSDNQFSALVSFCYNIGISAFKKSTLLKKLNKGDYSAVPSELMKWVNDGGKRVQGLVNRRSAEAGLWAKGSFVSSSYETPQPLKHNAVLKPEVVGPVISAASGLTGFATGSGPFQWALAAIMVAAAATGICFFVVRLREQTR